MRKLLSEITPYIMQNDFNNEELNIICSPGIIHITCEPWDHIRTTQRAILYINDQCISATELFSKSENLAHPPIFSIVANENLISGELNKIYIEVIEYDGSENPNKSKSSELIFKH